MLIATPTRSRRSGDQSEKSSPESVTASCAAAIPKWMKRLIRRAILRSMAMVGSNPLTSAAIRTSNRDASKEVMGPPPFTPASRFRQYVG